MQAATAAPFIEQDYSLYTLEDQQAWRRLYQGMQPLWERYAARDFRQGLEALRLDPERIPRLSEVNRFLAPTTGFRARAVSGYVPANLFFECLRTRDFPTTVTIRPLSRLDYLPEPDIFHDVCGHVPMHTDPVFAEVLVSLGECAHSAAELCPPASLNAVMQAMARFFWFTVEFGLVCEAGVLKAYGSGLVSSRGEIVHAVRAAQVRRESAALDSMINQPFEIDHYQPLLFEMEGTDHLLSMADELRKRIRAGQIRQVAPGNPFIPGAAIGSD